MPFKRATVDGRGLFLSRGGDKSYGSTTTADIAAAGASLDFLSLCDRQGYHDDELVPSSSSSSTQSPEEDLSERERRKKDSSCPSWTKSGLKGLGVMTLFAASVATTSRWQLATRDADQGYEIPGAGASSEARPSPETIPSKAMAAPTILPTGHDMPLSSLRFTASNEYGVYDPSALALYGLEMVVEPYKETRIVASGGSSSSGEESTFTWRITVDVEEGEDGGTSEYNPISMKRNARRLTVLSTELQSAEITVSLTIPGGVYLLTADERNESGTLLSEGSVEVSCKYVRREIRDLTDVDRTAFFNALAVYYTVSDEEGKAKYGQAFSNYQRTTAYHNSPKSHFCYHGGLQFLTAHAAFSLMVERFLQAIDPGVALPFWDYMIEGSTLGVKWPESTIFGNDMFGRAIGSAENNYQLTEGRFGNVSSIYDPDDTLVDSDISPYHNAYGYINAEYNYQDLPRLTRAASFCELGAHAKFATSDVLVACFENHDTLGSWELCMEKNVHGNIHGLLGGAFHCSVDMNEFHNQHAEKYSPGLLTFILEYMTANEWPSNSFMPDDNDCDSDCVRGQGESCGCTCRVDAFSLSEDEVYSLMSRVLNVASHRFAGSSFVSYDESSPRPWGFMQDGVRLDDDDTMLLFRHLVKIGCEPGAVGHMSSGASPMDPIFWVLHPIFEKALHVLWMSPKFRDKYTFEWEDGSCNGSKLYDRLPFTEKSLGVGPGTEFLTNAELMQLLHAGNPGWSYVYEKFNKWGTKIDWKFCEECTTGGNATGGNASE